MDPDKLRSCRTCIWWSDNFLSKTQECCHKSIDRPTPAEFSCPNYTSMNSTEFNVPNHAGAEAGVAPRASGFVPGPCEILIVSYSKDLPWLELCLESIRKFLTGFQGVTIAYPEHETHLFAHLPVKFGTRGFSYPEVAGKGMVQHMIIMAEAEKIVPRDTQFVLLCDSDCIFRMPTSPTDYFTAGKPHYLIRTWESLTRQDPRDPRKKVVSDCLQWKAPTDRQLGFDTPFYTMCLNTSVFPINFFPRYRAGVSAVQRKPFPQFMLEGQNTFPQSVMDWTAMGAWAHRFMHDEFTWFDVDRGEYPVDRKKAFWSHGGVTPEIREEIRNILL